MGLFGKKKRTRRVRVEQPPTKPKGRHRRRRYMTWSSSDSSSSSKLRRRVKRKKSRQEVMIPAPVELSVSSDGIFTWDSSEMSVYKGPAYRDDSDIRGESPPPRQKPQYQRQHRRRQETPSERKRRLFGENQINYFDSSSFYKKRSLVAFSQRSRKLIAFSHIFSDGEPWDTVVGELLVDDGDLLTDVIVTVFEPFAPLFTSALWAC